MAKLVKIALRFLGGILEWTLILLIAFVFAIRLPQVQTYLGQKATNYLSKELGTYVHVEGVSVIFFDRFALDGVIVLDQQKDTLAGIGSVLVVLNEFDNKKKTIDLDRAVLRDGKIRLNRSKETGEFNFQYLIDYFDSGDTTKSEPYLVKLNKLSVERVDFKYDDYQEEALEFGMDYAHLAVKDLYLDSDFKMLKDGSIETNIHRLALKEKSGFELRSLTGRSSFGEKGLAMSNVDIRTPNSSLHFPKLGLKTRELSDFSEFVDKVVFDVQLTKSQVSLRDVSYFATVMEGMDQDLELEAVLSKRIKDLKISDLLLKTGEKTVLQGSFNLPDFRKLEEALFDENLSYAYIDVRDLEQILLPVSSSNRHLDLGEQLGRLKYVQLEDLRLDGFYSQFVLKSDRIKTALGSVSLENGILFTENKKRNSFLFDPSSSSSKYDVAVDSFLLGKFLDDPSLGSLSGDFFLKGELHQNGDVDFASIEGDLKRFDYQGYAYRDIRIREGSLIDNVFLGKLDVKDDNIDLAYNGMLDFNSKQRFSFQIDIGKALLDQLNLTTADSSRLRSSFKVDISGTNPNNYSGEIVLKGFLYGEGKKEFEVPSMTIQMNRNGKEDVLKVASEIADLEIRGKVDFGLVASELGNQFHKIFPALIPKKELKLKKPSRFSYLVKVKQVHDLLSIFVPGLAIAPNTELKGEYLGSQEKFTMFIQSPGMSYEEIALEDIQVEQVINDSILNASYKFGRLKLNDSLSVGQLSFLAEGSSGNIDSKLKWNPDTPNESYFSWKTKVLALDHFQIDLDPSYFSIKEHHWDILNNSQVTWSPNSIQVKDFKMQREHQFLEMNGAISERIEDVLRMNINDLELEDFAGLMGLPIAVEGKLNGQASVSDPFNRMLFSSRAEIRDLLVDGQEVGDINVTGGWNHETKSVALAGELFYKKNKTFDFKGKYFVEREKDNLDLNLDFDYTDIQFTNAFMDPQVVSGIRGLLDGQLRVTGTPELPQLVGKINLLGGNAKVEMFGVNFGFNGEIKFDQYGMYIDNMPVTDEDGNMGSMVGTVFHDNFANWNFDLAFNLEDDAAALKAGIIGRPLERFLVMNTSYKEGDIYYGKAYATGRADIYGFADNLRIDVDLETKRETVVNFPMYGTGEIEEDKFLIFEEDTVKLAEESNVDLTGVDMNLNFKVTPEAKLRVIFDEVTGDVITAYGNSSITIGVDNLGDVTMDGVFQIANPSSDRSVYNFAMGPVRQPFYIVEGGTISWTGDPYVAKLDLKTYTPVQTSLTEIMPNIENSKSNLTKEVRCYLYLTQTLDEPLITFDIDVLKATENDRAALNRIRGDKDELNKQFFSLLLVKKFQPLQGHLSAGSGAALDLVSSQINDALNKMSGDVKFDVGLKNDRQSGENSAEVGLSKSILDDRLVIKGSLGVENTSDGTSNHSSFIGDVNLEYLINEEGTFRVSIFNESNDNTVIQEKNLGPFTQGAGLSYQEDFNNWHDFKMVQYFLDLFRKEGKKKYPIKKNERRKELPPLPGGGGAKPE
ncbi:MAG: hypothetical protein EP338_14385 [Bacteroidetes bacterium]|nr:MAG: hypothetical protein EP338_14385 [Bacteroidota bacterium]